jgi:hypothetical protein
VSEEQRSSWLGKKPRPMEELLRDSAFPYQVGKLVGAASMAAYWMTLSEDDESKKMGEKLNEMVGWFYTEQNRKEDK